ncbi:ThuA domain-containing protein [Urbifossiella limnaea]|uniref:Trehalose utilization n=1 Tax=Urbifossiella limnaea TaxID=2528023 RepID=A0A517XZZ3_9BACT|nr:ThuA domain-containing protein [Urbifossiella limnaea]QDU23084.1 Trehalose utilization [Urbifossiella limnaea]
MPLSRRAFLGTAAATLATPGLAQPPKAKKLVLMAGTPSHGPGDHEFNAGVQLLANCLKDVRGLETVVFRNGYPADDSILDTADGILCFADGGAGHPLVRERRLTRIDALMRKGVGLMCAHYGVEVPRDLGGPEFQRWIGGYYESGFSCNPMWRPEFSEFPRHPIANGVRPFAVRDEWYFNMRFRDNMQGVTPILSAKPSDEVRDGPYVYPRGPYPHIQAAKGRAETMMWAVERPDGGRGVGFTGGHFHRNWATDDFRKVVLNALVWLVKLDVPAEGVVSRVTEAEMMANLDPKKK